MTETLSRESEAMSEKPSVLVVEFGAGTRETLCAILEDAGYNVCGVETRSEAAARMHDTAFNVVLTDMKLPDLDGLGMLQIAAETNPEAAVIVLADEADVEAVAEAVGRRVSACLAKPARAWEVRTVVANALRQQRLAAENRRLTESLRCSSMLVSRANEALRSDLLEREQMERALRVAAQEWRTTFDAIGDGVCLLDGEGRVIRCNQAAARLLGLPYADINGRSLGELLYRQNGPEHGCPFERMQQTRRRETGTMFRAGRWYEVSVDPLPAGNDGLAGAVYIISDVTGRGQMGEALRPEL